MAFTRWDPLRDLLALQEQLERFSGQDAAGWTPPVLFSLLAVVLLGRASRR